MDPRSGLRLKVITTQRRLIASRLLFVVPRGSVFLCHSCWASASVRLAILRSVFRSFSTSKRHQFTTHTLRGQIVRWNFVIFSISVKNARRAMVRGPSTLWVLRVWLFEDFFEGLSSVESQRKCKRRLCTLLLPPLGRSRSAPASWQCWSARLFSVQNMWRKRIESGVSFAWTIVKKA